MNDRARPIWAAVARPWIRLITVRAFHLSPNTHQHGAIPPSVCDRPCLLAKVDGPSNHAHDEEPQGVGGVHSDDETTERSRYGNPPDKLGEGTAHLLRADWRSICVVENDPPRGQADLSPRRATHQRDLLVDGGCITHGLVGVVLGPCLVPTEVLREAGRLMSDNLACHDLLRCCNVRLAHRPAQKHAERSAHADDHPNDESESKRREHVAHNPGNHAHDRGDNDPRHGDNDGHGNRDRSQSTVSV